MSPAEFLADIEVAVTNRNDALDRSPRRSVTRGDDGIELVPVAPASPPDEHNAERPA